MSGRPRAFRNSSSWRRPRARRRRAQRHHALLVALAETAQQAAFEVDVGDPQPHDLAGAQAAAVEQLDQGEVALGERPFERHAGKHRLDLVDAQHPGQVTRMLGRRQVGGGVGAQVALAHEVPVEPPHGGHAARHAGRGTVAARTGEVAVHVVLARRDHGAHRCRSARIDAVAPAPAAVEPGREGREVATVRGDRVRPQRALELEEREVVVDDRVADRLGRHARWRPRPRAAGRAAAGRLRPDARPAGARRASGPAPCRRSG